MKALLVGASALAVIFALVFFIPLHPFGSYKKCVENTAQGKDWVEKKLKCIRTYQQKIPTNLISNIDGSASIDPDADRIYLHFKNDNGDWIVTGLTISVQIDGDITNYKTDLLLINPYEKDDVNLPIKEVTGPLKKGKWTWGIHSAKGIKK